MTAPIAHQQPREAGPELLVLQKWEAFTGWLLAHTARWPKSHRFTFVQRLQNLALDITEALVEARYERASRARLLRQVNLGFERMRLLCRIAREAGVMPKRGFEVAMRGIDEAGRMVHGWRRSLDGRRRAQAKQPQRGATGAIEP